MKAVLLSVRPQWCEKIACGKKPLEVRKNRPKIETPFKCYIYCTRPTKFYSYMPNCYTSIEYLHLSDGKVSMGDGFDLFDKEYKVLNGKVIGEFVCDKIDMLAPLNHCDLDVEKYACLTREQIVNYLKGKGYAWHISDLVIYDKPRELSEFAKPRVDVTGLIYSKQITRPPQSWCYVEDDV